VPRVLVIGSANVDFVVHVERLPAPGGTVSEGTLLVDHGGKGANQARPSLPARAAVDALAQSEGASTAPSEASPRIELRQQSRRSNRG
jgi:ribokinase